MKKIKLIALAFAGFMMLGCNQQQQPETEADANIEDNSASAANENASQATGGEMTNDDFEMMMKDPHLPLMDRLQMKMTMSLGSMSAEKQKDYDEGIQALVTSGQFDKIKIEGDVAPNFTAKNVKGEEITLYEELKKKPVVLVWYRGGWCPYCNITLQEYARYNDQFEEAGYQVIAISPEMVDSAYSTSTELGLPFAVLSDKGNIAAEKYGLKFELTGAVKKWYDKGFGMETYNGDDSGTLPIAGTYVIGQDKTIHAVGFLPDYRMRIGPMELLPMLQEGKM